MSDSINGLRFEGTPSNLKTWLGTLGWTEEAGPNSGSTSASVLAFGPVEVRSVMGTDVAFVLLALADDANLDLPDGVFQSDIGAASVGGFMPGKSLPTPLEWMDRLTPNRQADILDALDASKETRRFKARLLAARSVDPTLDETIDSVNAMREAGVLTAAEATRLLEP